MLNFGVERKDTLEKTISVFIWDCPAIGGIDNPSVLQSGPMPIVRSMPYQNLMIGELAEVNTME